MVLYLLTIAVLGTAMLLLIALAWPLLGVPLALLLQDRVPDAERFGAGALSQAIFVAAVVVVTYLFRRLLDRRSFSSLGLERAPGWLREAWAGFGLGAALMGFILVAELALGGYRLRGFGWQERGPEVLLGLLAVTFGGFCVVAFYEELLARGYILQNLALAWGLPAGVLASSALFALGHLRNPGAGPLSSVGLFFAGLLLAAGYIATGRLWLPIGLHLSWNFVQGPVLGFPVSGLETGGLLSLEAVGPEALTGGRFGPEASLVGVAAELLGIGLLWGWGRRARVPRGAG